MSDQSNKTNSKVMNTYNRWNIEASHGEGSYIWDTSGRKYLDYTSGIAVNIFGHNYDPIVNTIREQAGKLLHTSNLFRIPSQERLAQQLTDHAGYGKVFFSNSGAEANEAAVKAARRYQQIVKGRDRFEIITFKKSFHGRTLATVTATAQPKYQEGFQPLPQGFIYCPLNDLAAVEAAITEQTAAIMLELLQGEGGVHPVDPDFLTGLQKIAAERDILIMIDEVQTGVYRTGSMFLWQQYEGFRPDVFTLAKGLGGGVPIGACIARDEVADALVPGTHASTFGGNPLVTSVASTVIAELDRAEIQAMIRGNIDNFQLELDKLEADYPNKIQAIRGVGLIRGIELAEGIEAVKVMLACQDAGLLLVTAGDNTIRFLPPLNTSQAEIEEAMIIFRQVLDEILK